MVTFLDLQVTSNNGFIFTKLFRKPTATNSLLDYRSIHPLHTRNGVPTGQFLRVRRNCTADEDFRIEAHNLTDRFKERHYPRRSISMAFQRARTHTQESLMDTRVKVLMRSSCLQDFWDEIGSPLLQFAGVGPRDFHGEWMAPVLSSDQN
ncbi:uncharacterized protein LOC143809817 [Ranitomeya variabilis]|uniref:uncharacterized protein LOC143809817 n=1 Tax=Ranitomeya variabilis TaxID=490064 RepID=UPI004055D943